MREIGSSSQHVGLPNIYSFPYWYETKAPIPFPTFLKENPRLNSALATERVEATRASGSRRVDDGWQNPTGAVLGESKYAAVCES